MFGGFLICATRTEEVGFLIYAQVKTFIVCVGIICKKKLILLTEIEVVCDKPELRGFLFIRSKIVNGEKVIR